MKEPRNRAPAGAAGGTLHNRDNAHGSRGTPQTPSTGRYRVPLAAYPGFRPQRSGRTRRTEARRAGRLLLERCGGDLEEAFGVLALRIEDQGSRS
jgi:hypothetical protein